MNVNKNKWVVSAASVALVASAIVPVASAASFSDIEDTDHKEAILALAEAGIVSGYTDGTFKPNAVVTRGNVTKFLGKWLVSEGYEIPADFDKEARFTDLPTTHGDQELVKFAALVKDAGVFKGSNNKLMFTNNMSREQMAVVLVRAINTVYGVDLVADYKAENYETKITDLDKATTDENREAIIALEYAELTKVTAFNPKNSLTRGQFASFLNRTVTSIDKEEVELTVKTVTVKDATTLEVTLSDDTTHTVTLPTALPENTETNVEFVINEKTYSTLVTYTALTVKTVTVKDATTLEVTLSDDTTHTVTLPTALPENEETTVEFVINEKTYSALVTYETDVNVKSVSAINNKEILVTFNKAVDKDTAEAAGNYTLTAVTTGGAATFGSAKLQADGKSVVVTLGTEASNQETYKLTAKNLKDASGKAIATTENEVKFFDTTLPTVSDVTVVAPRTVKVNFSEPVKTAPSVKLGNGSVSTTVTLSADKKSATVEFGIEPTLGNHDLEIQGGADYANLKIEKVVKSFEYKTDATAPIVSVDKANANTVTLKFSKPVSVKSAANVSVYHTINNSGAYVGGALTPVSAVNGFTDTYTVTFGTPIPEGAVKVFLNTKANALEDGWGNDVASVELSSTAVVDKAAPVITGVKAVSDKKLEVTFDEDVNVADAQKLANYILKDASGTVLSDKDYNFVNAKGEFLSNVSIVYSAKKATITLPSSLKGGNFSLTVKEIKDASFLENKLTSQDIAVAITDTTAWDITGNALRSADNKKVRITFNETMSADSLTDLSKYELRTAGGAKVDFPTDTKVVVLSPKAVEIQLGATEATATKVRVSGTLKDASGNTFNELFKEVTIAAEAGPVEASPSTAKTTATDKVQFTVDQELTGSLTPADFTTTGGITFGGASYVNKDGKSTVTLTVASGSTKFAKAATPTVTVAENALQSIYGAKNGSTFNVVAADGIAPSVLKNLVGELVISNTANTDNITVQFDEVLSVTNATLAATDLVVTDSAGKNLVGGVDYTTSIATDILTIDLVGTYNGYVGKLTVASKATPVYIVDGATVGNTATAFAATEVTIGDSTAPTFAATYPSATPGAVASKEVTLKVKANEAGTAYFLVVADEAAPPTAAVVAASADSVALTANTEASKVLTMVADAIAYDVYVVVKDAAGNLTAPVKVDVTSPAVS